MKKGTARRPTPAKSVAEYLAALPTDKRHALARLRAQIKAAAPGVSETISYGMPAYKLGGKVVVYFAAATNHCSLYAVPDRDVTGALRAELARYDTSGKGTLRFTPREAASRLARDEAGQGACPWPVISALTPTRPRTLGGGPHPIQCPLIPGGVLAMIGGSLFVGGTGAAEEVARWWPIVLVAVGILVLLGGTRQRSRSNTP